MTLLRTLLFAFTLAVASSASAKSSDSSPNVILVFIDDMGWGDFSCFGNTNASTPHIDKLAEEGIAFEQFYVNSPICSPSRTAISSGTYPQRWNITSYLAHRHTNEKRGIANWLDPKAPMLARTLQSNGYATGHFGKWHMGGQRDVTNAPAITEYGFDESLTNFEGLGPKLLPLTLTPDGKKGRVWQKAEILGGPVTWMQRSHVTEGFVDASITFIDKAIKAKKPFYINLWPDDVHTPLFPPIDKWGNKSKRDKYLGVLEAMDEQLGKLFTHITSDKNLRENTLILVCSDNGPEKGAGVAGPFKGYKTHLYEGGVRSSLIAWGPGLINKKAIGSRNTTSVFSAIDLVPSLSALCGIETTHSAWDGENVLSTLLGSGKQSRKEPLFFSRPPDRKSYYGFENLPDLAVRAGKWKFLCDYDGGRPELYDLSSDPGESENLADQHIELVNELTKKTLAWYNEVTKGDS